MNPIGKEIMAYLTIYFATSDWQTINSIRKRFNIPSRMTVNGETKADIKDEDLPLLIETARQGYIQIRNKHQ